MAGSCPANRPKGGTHKIFSGSCQLRDLISSRVFRGSSGTPFEVPRGRVGSRRSGKSRQTPASVGDLAIWASGGRRESPPNADFFGRDSEGVSQEPAKNGRPHFPGVCDPILNREQIQISPTLLIYAAKKTHPPPLPTSTAAVRQCMKQIF
jgi:hypothetical protein